MRKIVRAVKRVLVCLIGLLLLGLGAVLVLRAHRQHATAQAMAIHAPNGIDEGMYVKIGGIDQWIQIRGQDRDNPVLLCLHGGPGGTWIPLTALFVPREKEFTVVQWDQRSAGKTLETTGGSVADTMSVDGLKMASKSPNSSGIIYTRTELFSWGIPGAPFSEFTSQNSGPTSFMLMSGQAKLATCREVSSSVMLMSSKQLDLANDKEAVRELESIGSPPYDRMGKALVHFNWHGKYQVESDRAALASPIGSFTSPAPNYSLWDEINRIRGFAAIPTWRIYNEMLSADLPSLGADFKIPVYFFQGAEDELTVTPLTKEYFDEINGPHKEMVLLGGLAISLS